MTAQLSPRDRLIVAVDVDDPALAARIYGDLHETVGCFKIGLQLLVKFAYQGMGLAAGAGWPGIPLDPRRLFMDWKANDTPRTMAAMAAQAAGVPPKFMTIHPVAASAANRDAIAAVQRAGTTVLCVTVLTSMDADDLRLLNGMDANPDPAALAISRAVFAHERLGCAGIVCSPHEARAIKDRCGEGLATVCPGIRPAWAEVTQDDQKRVMAPAEAVRAGADYIVVGRPIVAAPDRRAAAQRIVDELAAV